MTRLTGIRLFFGSIVLWALAVWIFGTSPPAPMQDTAALSADEAEQSTEPGAGEGRAAGVDAPTVPAPTVPALQTRAEQGATTAADPDPGAGAESALSRSGPTLAGGTAPTSSPADDPSVPAVDAPAPPVVTGEDTRVALARTPAGGDPATETTTLPPAAGAGPRAGRPALPPATGTGSVQGGRDGFDSLAPAPAPAYPQFGYPHSRSPRAWTGGPSGLGNAVAGEIDAARRAAWEGRLPDALAHYRAAARIRPDSHVVWGEMGNVLWAMRRWSEAAYALEGAATLLVRAGELHAANELVPAVGRIDPDAATRIQRLLWAAAQRQSG